MATFYVKIETGSEEFKVDLSGNIPKIFLKSDPRHGEANKELITRLSEIFGKKTGIMSGHHRRRKKLIIDIEKDEVLSILRDYHV